MKRYLFWRDRFLCSIFGHWWIPSEYAGCKDTHEDCMLCGKFRVKKER